MVGQFHTYDPDYRKYGKSGIYGDGYKLPGQIRTDQLPPGTVYNQKKTLHDSKDHCVRIRGELEIGKQGVKFRQDGEQNSAGIRNSQFPPDGLDFIEEDNFNGKEYRGKYKPSTLT